MDLDRLAQRQHGIVTRAQAQACGLTAKQIGHRVTSQRWQRIFRGVYATHSGPISWLARASAAVLYAGAGAALTQSAAACLWGLGRTEPPVIRVAVPAHREVVRPPGVRVVRRRRLQTTTRRGITVTTALQTVLDLTTSPDATADDVVALIATAVHRDLVSVAQLRAGIDERRTGRRLVRVAIGDVEAGVRSAVEARVRTDVIERHHLPGFAHQMPVAGADAEDRRLRDLENQEFGVIVEVDGALWHSGAAFQVDRTRDRQAAAEGKVTVRVTWADSVSRPCVVARDLALTMRHRGWRGSPRPCGARCNVWTAA